MIRLNCLRFYSDIYTEFRFEEEHHFWVFYIFRFDNKYWNLSVYSKNLPCQRRSKFGYLQELVKPQYYQYKKMKKLIFTIPLITSVMSASSYEVTSTNTANKNALSDFSKLSSINSFNSFGNVGLSSSSSGILSSSGSTKSSLTAISSSGSTIGSSTDKSASFSSSSGQAERQALINSILSGKNIQTLQSQGRGQSGVVTTRTVTLTSTSGQSSGTSNNGNLNGGSFGSLASNGIAGGSVKTNLNQTSITNANTASTGFTAYSASTTSTKQPSQTINQNQSIGQTILQQQTQTNLISTQPTSFPEIDKNSPEFSDPEFLKIINNYFGCKTWQNGECVSCSQNFYFNEKGICCEVKPQCQQFNIAVGICERCYPGYTVVDGQCEKIDIAQNIAYKGCRTFNFNNPNQANQCVQCAARYVFRNGVCTQVNADCQTWNTQGACQTCYKGFVISGNNCVVDTRIVTNDDPLCGQVRGSTCVSCAQRAYFNAQGKCQQVSKDCNTWDRLTGSCLSCYKGYALNQNKQCSLLPSVGPSDNGCAEWNWDKQVCLKCSERWVFNSGGKCQILDENCFTFNPSQSTKCLTCYKGYALNRISGVCELDPVNLQPPKDKGCAEWNWDKQVCLKCSERYRFNSRGICQQLDVNCRTYDRQGNCLECYKGYIVSNNTCTVNPLNLIPPIDQGCRNWNWDLQVCLDCSERWMFDNQGKCQPLDQNCRQFTRQGDCSVCYKGYRVNQTDGTCVIRQENVNGPTDVGCAKWNWDLQVCEKCSIRWAFDSRGKCIALPSDCKSFNSQNVCVECYSGYRLNTLTNSCMIFDDGVVAANLDKGCAEWDWATLTCLKCSERYVFDVNGVCNPLDNNCKTFNSQSICIQCYKGFELNKLNQCQQSLKNINGPSDLGCARWNWDSQFCLQCAPKWRFNAQGRCVQVDLNCLQFNTQTQACISCYKGFILDKRTATCVIDPVNLNPVKDLGCNDWNWDLQVCLQCSERYVFNSQGICTPLDPNCRTFNTNNSCLECYKGYKISGTTCVLDEKINLPATDVGCAQWNWDSQICTKCSVRYMMNSRGQCIKQQDDCENFNSNGICTKCYKGFILNSANQCILSLQTSPTDKNCKLWDWDNQICLECSQRHVFDSAGKCKQVNDSCRQFDRQGLCTACYKGYVLNSAKTCQLSQVQITGPTDLGCAEWNWDQQICLKCSQRYIFDSRNICRKVDDLCAQWNTVTGACVSCYEGYMLVGDKCVLKTPFCKKQDIIGNCQQCYDGFVLYKGQCTPLSRIADIALYYAECCPEKLQQLKQSGRLL